MKERPVAAPEHWTGPKELVKAYREGDPLWVIAAARDATVESLCSLLAQEVCDEDELARMQTIRSRAAGAMSVLEEQSQLVWRLMESGFSAVEIPTVLGALATGSASDSAITAALLQFVRLQDPRICRDMPPPETLRRSDTLSLLYVLGKHHGIKPDYQLALGQIAPDDVAELKQLTRAACPPRRLAEILAVAETTKLAIRARVITGLSVTDYAATAGSIARLFRGYIFDESASWPTPASDLVRRLGGGFWDQALATVRLEMGRAVDRFQEDDFPLTVDDFTEERSGRGLAPSLENYDQWVIAELAVRRDRPSALELVDRYGDWAAALRKALASRSDVQTDAHASAMPLHDDGALFEVPDPAHEAAWVRAGEYICELLARIPRRRSLVIEYAAAADGAFQLYARAGRAEAGVWCEIFPDELLSGELSDTDEDHLACEGWTSPNDASSSWRREGMLFEDAGHLILDGLRYGRQCPDPWLLRWSTRQPINGQGRYNGVTTEDALAGDVQSLRNAG
ncbi:TY-Chap domain-containing protein [Arthrobacter sp. NQ4]|uniref:TY-Chap domain-containing protein n=1 Tax=Arthrobacter sp. NQ4 TaxID=3027930 RepID=UPI0023AF5620|nr:hypothetical protein [Arthrobacter sp. NQ4]MDE8588353.1 hypothetical protein [Arthrobacter sp. NQ4]